MEFNLFIIPITMILTQLAKDILPTKYLPHFAVVAGLVAGIGFGLYYGQDAFVHGVTGTVYGASASGIYDLAKNTVS